MNFEYFVQESADEKYPYELVCRAEDGRFIGYQLTQGWKSRLTNDSRTLEYLCWRLNMNLKDIMEREEVV